MIRTGLSICLAAGLLRAPAAPLPEPSFRVAFPDGGMALTNGVSLAYPARGAVRSSRGTLMFRLKRGVWREGTRHRVLRLADTKTRLGHDPSDRTGLIAFSFLQKGGIGRLQVEHDDVKGSRRQAPAFVPIEPGRWERWFVTWDETNGARFFVTDGVRVEAPPPTRTSASLRDAGRKPSLVFASAASTEREIWIGAAPDGGSPLDGVLSEVTVWREPLTRAQILASLATERLASLSCSAHYGTAGVTKEIVATVRSCNGADLSSAHLDLVDAQGAVVVPGGALDRDGGLRTLAATLPFGDYRVVVRRSGRILAECAYGVLSATNPFVLPPVADDVGQPRRLALLGTVKPDLATLSSAAFRRVGDCRMGELGGVSYLEAGTNVWDRFALRLAVDTNAPLHCIEIDYPDDRRRTMDVVVQNARYGRDLGGPHGLDHTLSVGVMTGGPEYANTGRLLTHRCLFWTGESADIALIAATASKNAPAAIAEVRVYRVVDGALPAARVLAAPRTDEGWNRYVGQWWEDPALNYDFRAGQDTLADLDRQINRLVAQMKYCGQNLWAYPGAWYEGLLARDGYQPRSERIREGFLEAFYEKFDREGLFAMPTVEVLHLSVPDGTVVSSVTLTNGALYATSFAVQDSGRPVAGVHNDPPHHNVAHPDVQNALVRIVEALADEGSAHPSFKGVSLFLPVDACAWWGMIGSGYNDYCLDAFARATGIRVPVDRADPLRGKAAAAWLKANAYEPWVQWRCDVVTELFARLAGILRVRRADLKLRLDVEPPVDPQTRPNKYPDFFTDALRPRLLREGGIDAVALARRIPNLIFGPAVYNGRQRRRESWLPDAKAAARYIELPTTRAWYVGLEESAFPQVLVRDDFWESDIGRTRDAARRLSGDWLTEIPWRVSAINASGRNALKYFVLPLRHNDILGVSRGGFLIGDYGMEAAEARFAQAFRALPAVKMADVPSEDGAEGLVRVRQADFRGQSYFYLVNTGARPSGIVVRLPPSTVDLVSGRAVRHDDLARLARGVRVTLDAYELRSFRADASAVPQWRYAERSHEGFAK